LGPGLFSSNFTIKPCRHFSSPSYVLYTPPTFILHDVLTQIIYGEEYRSRSCQLCDCFQSPVTSSLFIPNIFLSTLTLTLSAYDIPRMWGTKFRTSIQQQAKLLFCVV
jgi:hypothetical protein